MQGTQNANTRIVVFFTISLFIIIFYIFRSYVCHHQGETYSQGTHVTLIRVLIKFSFLNMKICN
jgi:hypothetical protein